MTKKDDLIEKVAEAIYHTEGGVTEEEFKIILGHGRRSWKTNASWDKNNDELREHERCEYRLQAKTVVELIIKFIADNNISLDEIDS